MAYESDDIVPPVPAAQQVQAAGCRLQEQQGEAASRRLNQNSFRPDDEDICPEAPPPEFLDIDLPDSKEPCGGAAPAQGGAGEEASLPPFLNAILWVLGGAVALWLYFQLAGLFRLVLECHGWRLWLASAMFAVPVAALACVAVKFARVFRRLPAREQIKGDLNASGIDLKCELKRRLKPYVDGLRQDYALAFGPEDRARVSDCIRRLQEDRSYSDDGGWIADFILFHNDQEKCASGAVKTYCKLVALKTAACPWKAIDMVIVATNLTLMVVKIAKVYNRRISRGGAFRLLCHWFVNIYVSGELGAIAESASAGAADKVKDWLVGQESAAEGAAEGAAGAAADAAASSADSLPGLFSASLPVLSKFAGKAAEGAINAYFAYRMGRRAIDEFKWVG